MFDISRRIDLDGLPYQFYVQFYSKNAMMRQITVQKVLHGSVPQYCQQLRDVANAIEACFTREEAEADDAVVQFQGVAHEKPREHEADDIQELGER